MTNIFVIMKETLGGYKDVVKAFSHKDKAEEFIKGKSNEIQGFEIEEIILHQEWGRPCSEEDSCFQTSGKSFCNYMDNKDHFERQLKIVRHIKIDCDRSFEAKNSNPKDKVFYCEVYSLYPVFQVADVVFFTEQGWSEHKTFNDIIWE